MPIYEYRCAVCGHETEALQKMSDAPLTDCPSCGKPALTKLISAAGFQLKGSGWYVTDFRGGSRPKADPAAKGDEAANGDARVAGQAGEKAATGTGEDGKAKDAKSDSSASAAPAPAAS
jgi:putative FmdB family regulatory protein